MEIYSYLSDSAKQVLEVASNEAKELKQNYVGTEHLLLGLMHEQCPVAYLFKNTSLTLQGVREYIADLHKNIDSMFSSIFSYTAKAKRCCAVRGGGKERGPAGGAGKYR